MRTLFTLFIVLFAANAGAAPAWVKGTDVVTGSTLSPAITLNGVVAGNLLRLCGRFNSESATVSISTDSTGNTWLLEQGPYNHTSGTATHRGYCWYVKQAVGGNTLVTLSASSVVTCVCHIEEYTGTDPVNPLAGAGGGESLSPATAIAVDVIPDVPREGIAVGFIATSVVRTLTVGSGFTARNTSTLGDTEDAPYSAGESPVTIDASFDSGTSGIILGALYVGPAPPESGPEVVQCAAAVETTDTAHVINLAAVGAGNLIAVNSKYLTETTTATIADSVGHTWEVALGPTDYTIGIGGRRDYHWFAKNTTAGDTVITVTTSTSLESHVWACEVAGVSTTDPLGDTAAEQFDESTTEWATSLVLDTAGVIIASVFTNAPTTITPGDGFTNLDITEYGTVMTSNVTAGEFIVDATVDSAHGLLTAVAYVADPEDPPDEPVISGCIFGAGFFCQ